MPHIHDLYDFTVSAYIVHDNKVLLVEHPKYKMWLSPGGHVELDEDLDEALFREVAEETGLAVTFLSSRPDFMAPGSKALLTPNYAGVHEANAPHRHIDLVYFAIAQSGQAKLSEEHTRLQWFSKSMLHESRYDLHPAVIFYAEAALAAAGQVKHS